MKKIPFIFFALSCLIFLSCGKVENPVIVPPTVKGSSFAEHNNSDVSSKRNPAGGLQLQSAKRL